MRQSTSQLTATIFIALLGPAWPLPQHPTHDPTTTLENTPPADSCLQTLARVCSGATADVGQCQHCVGIHQHEIKAAHCSVSDIPTWCLEAVTIEAAIRRNIVHDAQPPYRVANLFNRQGATAVAFDPSTQQLFQGSSCQRRSSYDDECKSSTTNITWWDVQSQTQLGTLQAHNATITALAYDTIRQILFSTSNEAAPGECCGAILVWNTSTNPPTQAARLTSSQALETCNPRVSGAPQVGIRAMVLAEDRSRVFASCGNSVMQYDVTSLTTPVQLPSAMVGQQFEKESAITALVYDSESQVLFANSLGVAVDTVVDNPRPDRVIHRWSTGAAGHVPERLPDLVGHLGGVNALALEDGTSRRLFSASQTGEIISWDTTASVTLSISHSKSKSSGGGSKNSVAVQYLSFDNQTLYAGSTRGSVTIWDASSVPLIERSTVECSEAESSSDLRVQSILVDTIHRKLFCSATCVSSYSSDCPISGVTEVWNFQG